MIFSLLLSNTYNKPSYSKCLNMYRETENSGLSPQRIFSSLHYIDEQNTTDEDISHSFTSYVYRALQLKEFQLGLKVPATSL